MPTATIHPLPIAPPTADTAGTLSSAEFGAAVSAHRPYLIRFAQRRLQDAALVEDAVQETLLAALQAESAFEQRASLRTWLTGILLRRMADQLRSRYRGPMSSEVSRPDADADNDDGEETQRIEPIDWIDPARRLEGRQVLDALTEGLRRLPAQAAQVIALREFDGLSNEDAAHRLGLTPAQAALLLHRTRVRLRDWLGSDDTPARPDRTLAAA